MPVNSDDKSVVVPLPAGAATEATLAVVAGDTTSIDGKIPADPAREGGNLATTAAAAVVIAGDTTSIDGKIPALGAAAGAASSPTVLATDDAHLGAVGAPADVDGAVHEQLRYIGEGIDVLQDQLGLNVPNAPATPGKVTDVPGTTVALVELTAADLVPGVAYKLKIAPYDLGTNPAAPTDFIRGVYKCRAAGGAGPVDMDDGELVTTYAPEIIRLPAGSTKVRCYFLLDTATPLDCKVYLSICDA